MVSCIPGARWVNKAFLTTDSLGDVVLSWFWVFLVALFFSFFSGFTKRVMVAH